MLNARTSPTSYTAADLRALSERMPLNTAQALMFSEAHIKSYMDQHVIEALALNSNRAALMAAGRLELLLEQTRPSLSGMFTAKDWTQLLNCYQGEIFFPDQIRDIASDLCDDQGVDLDSYKASGIAPLLDKILALSAVQRLTLADALEQIWHRGFLENRAADDFLKELGIDLAE